MVSEIQRPVIGRAKRIAFRFNSLIRLFVLDAVIRAVDNRASHEYEGGQEEESFQPCAREIIAPDDYGVGLRGARLAIVLPRKLRSRCIMITRVYYARARHSISRVRAAFRDNIIRSNGDGGDELRARARIKFLPCARTIQPWIQPSFLSRSSRRNL